MTSKLKDRAAVFRGQEKGAPVAAPTPLPWGKSAWALGSIGLIRV